MDSRTGDVRKLLSRIAIVVALVTQPGIDMPFRLQEEEDEVCDENVLLNGFAAGSLH